jgi:hypothetical protein
MREALQVANMCVQGWYAGGLASGAFDPVHGSTCIMLRRWQSSHRFRRRVDDARQAFRLMGVNERPGALVAEMPTRQQTGSPEPRAAGSDLLEICFSSTNLPEGVISRRGACNGPGGWHLRAVWSSFSCVFNEGNMEVVYRLATSSGASTDRYGWTS